MKTISIHKLNKITKYVREIEDAYDDAYEDIRNSYKIISSRTKILGKYFKEYTEKEKEELLRTILWTFTDEARNQQLIELGWRIEDEKNKKKNVIRAS